MQIAKKLSNSENAALLKIKQEVSRLFVVRQFILFGSKARGDASHDSDIDLLIVTERELEHAERHKISKAVFEVNLEYNTQFSFIAIGSEKWGSERFGHMPLRINIGREGIVV